MTITYLPLEEFKDNHELLTYLAIINKNRKYPYLDVDWSKEKHDIMIRSILRTKTYNHESHSWLIQKDNVPIGWLYYFYDLVTDKHVLSADVYIDPQYRQQGIGAAALRYGYQQMKDLGKLEGKTRFHIDTKTLFTPEGMLNWLDEKGFSLIYTTRISGADLTNYDFNEVKVIAKELRVNAKAKGYHFVVVKNGNIERLRCSTQQFFKMREIIWNDMPSEDADWEYEPYNQAQHDENYEPVKLGDRSIMILCYNHENQPVGLTESWLKGEVPYILSQDDTGVLKEHRGNGLGKTLKYLLIDHLHQNYPEVADLKYWITGNASLNEHMIRINDEMKYEELARNHCHEIDLDKIVPYLEPK